MAEYEWLVLYVGFPALLLLQATTTTKLFSVMQLAEFLKGQVELLSKQLNNDGDAIVALEDELDDMRKDSKTRIAVLDRKKVDKPEEHVDRISHTEEEVEGKRR